MARGLDRPTLAALGVVAFTIKATVHEALGHGGAAVLMGCRPLAVSSAWWDGDCSVVADVTMAVRVVKAGGTLANLVVALVAALVFHRMRGASTGRYFAWLIVVTNLLSGGGYMMVDPLFGFGDWTAFIETFPDSAGLWRGVLVAFGLACSIAALILGKRWLLPWIGEGDDRRRRSAELCLIPYVAGAAAVPLSALLNPLGPVFAATSALSTFGGCAWLVWIGLDPARGTAEGEGEVARHPGWLVAGALSLVLLFGVLGPSLRFDG